MLYTYFIWFCRLQVATCARKLNTYPNYEDFEPSDNLLDIEEDLFLHQNSIVDHPNLDQPLYYYDGHGNTVNKFITNTKDSSYYPDNRPAGVKGITRSLLDFIHNVVYYYN